MTTFIQILKDAVAFALRGSISKAGAWANFPGALLAWAILYLHGYEVAVPDTIPQGVAVFLICAGAGWIILVVGRFFYWPFREVSRIRSLNASSLEFIFDPNDPRFVVSDREWLRYFVGVRNATPDNKTLYDIALFTDDSQFARRILDKGSGSLFRTWKRIDPDVTEWVELFGFDPNEAGSEWEGQHCFALEVRGKDAKRQTAQFEFDPNQRPALRMLTAAAKKSVSTAKPITERIHLDTLYEAMASTVARVAESERFAKFELLSIKLHDALGSTPGFRAYGRKISKNWIDDLVGHVPGLIEVPHKFWTDGGEIEWHTVDLTNPRNRCAARPHHDSTGEQGYFDLQFERDQIIALWPEMKLKG